VNDWEVVPDVVTGAGGTGVGEPAEELVSLVSVVSLSWACAICTEPGGTFVVAVIMMVEEEELVVLVELCPGTSVLPSASAAGAATKPVVRPAVVLVELAEVANVAESVVVASTTTLLALVVVNADDAAAAALGIAVHRRPLIVVRKAPDGRLLDTMFWISMSLLVTLSARPVASSEGKRGKTNENTGRKEGSAEANTHGH
jgi:hypothetical protein